MPIASDRINRLAAINGAQRYLEIGVAEGYTFMDVKIAHKTGIDPNFLFDYTKYSDLPGHHFFKTTSDDFFENLEDIKRNVYGENDFTWDIIFIDGLHTYGQAMRDFTNSLKYAHKNTLWVFDDTVPSDPWAAIPDIRECYFFRELAGVACKDWQGDVYKCVFVLHDFFPDFSYATIIGSGNPQTLVWRTETPVNRPKIFKNREDIIHLDYFGMLVRCGALNPMTEDEAFAFVGKPLDSPVRNGSPFLPSLVPHISTL